MFIFCPTSIPESRVQNIFYDSIKALSARENLSNNICYNWTQVMIIHYYDNPFIHMLKTWRGTQKHSGTFDRKLFHIINSIYWIFTLIFIQEWHGLWKKQKAMICLYHTRSWSWKYYKKKIWAATFRQTHQAEEARNQNKFEQQFKWQEYKLI
jgi:hypothetical protein